MLQVLHIKIHLNFSFDVFFLIKISRIFFSPFFSILINRIIFHQKRGKKSNFSSYSRKSNSIQSHFAFISLFAFFSTFCLHAIQFLVKYIIAVTAVTKVYQFFIAYSCFFYLFTHYVQCVGSIHKFCKVIQWNYRKYSFVFSRGYKNEKENWLLQCYKICKQPSVDISQEKKNFYIFFGDKKGRTLRWRRGKSAQMISEKPLTSKYKWCGCYGNVWKMFNQSHKTRIG